MGRPRKPQYINQREIVREVGGMTTEDILRWVRTEPRFPKPAKIIGRTRLFDRDQIERYFGLKGKGGDYDGQDDGGQVLNLATSEVSESLSQ